MSVYSDSRFVSAYSAIMVGMRPTIVALMGMLIVVGIVGCGGSDVSSASVQGTVTFDGEPIESGTIRFVPQGDGSGPPVELVIKDGSFQSTSSNPAAIGMNTVQIFASRATGKKIKTIMGEEADEVLPFVPPKYNESSELSVEVKSRGNDFKFDLLPE